MSNGGSIKNSHSHSSFPPMDRLVSTPGAVTCDFSLFAALQMNGKAFVIMRHKVLSRKVGAFGEFKGIRMYGRARGGAFKIAAAVAARRSGRNMIILQSCAWLFSLYCWTKAKGAGCDAIGRAFGQSTCGLSPEGCVNSIEFMRTDKNNSAHPCTLLSCRLIVTGLK